MLVKNNRNSYGQIEEPIFNNLPGNQMYLTVVHHNAF